MEGSCTCSETTNDSACWPISTRELLLHMKRDEALQSSVTRAHLSHVRPPLIFCKLQRPLLASGACPREIVRRYAEDPDLPYPYQWTPSGAKQENKIYSTKIYSTYKTAVGGADGHVRRVGDRTNNLQRQPDWKRKAVRLGGMERSVRRRGAMSLPWSDRIYYFAACHQQSASGCIAPGGRENEEEERCGGRELRGTLGYPVAIPNSKRR